MLAHIITHSTQQDTITGCIGKQMLYFGAWCGSVGDYVCCYAK